MLGSDAEHAGGLGMTALADVDDVVAARHQLPDEVVRPGDVAAGGVDEVEPARPGRLDDGRRDAVRGEDDRALCDLLERLHAIRFSNQRDARLLELAGHVLVVHQVAEHGDRLADPRAPRLPALRSVSLPPHRGSSHAA